MRDYPSWREFMEDYDRHDAIEQLLCQAVAALSTCTPYEHMTVEEVYEAVASSARLVYGEAG